MKTKIKRYSFILVEFLIASTVSTKVYALDSLAVKLLRINDTNKMIVVVSDTTLGLIRFINNTGTDGKLTICGQAIAKDTSAKLKSFNCKHAGEKNYLHWIIAHQKHDGFYLIYRSANGRNYELIGVENGIGVPIPFDIAYYYIDECPYNGNNFYLLLHISKNKTYILSDTITFLVQEKK